MLLCEYVRPQEPVTDYRTHVSGVTAAHLRSGAPFKDVQGRVAALLKGRILCGHGLHNDLKVRLSRLSFSLSRQLNLRSCVISARVVETHV